MQYKQLLPVGVRTSISHGQNARSSVFESEVLVIELASVDTLATRSVSLCEIPTLAHEAGDDSVELGTL